MHGHDAVTAFLLAHRANPRSSVRAPDDKARPLFSVIELIDFQGIF